MQRTPEHLTKQFAIAPEAGQGRAIPRALLAYTGPNKARFLTVTISGIMASVLPEYGQKKLYCRDATQQDLAGRASLARETYTRWMSEIATPDDAWTVEARLEQRRRSLEIHRRHGHQLHDRPRPSREHVETLISRRRRFMKPNRYSPVYPGHEDPRRAEEWFPPTMKEAKENEMLRTFFGKLLQGDKGFRRFKHIPQWLWHASLPLSWKARLVMTYYFMCGLGSKDSRTGKTIGVVKPRQKTVADALGISVRSVYNANCELARLSLIRVAHERIEHQDGSFSSGPQIIVYLPIRQLTAEEADFERKRLEFALLAARSTSHGGWMTPRVKELHKALLDEWEGKEHCLRAFWNQLRRNAIGEGIHLAVINSLIPSPPE
jgi:hypothetical protein